MIKRTYNRQLVFTNQISEEELTNALKGLNVGITARPNSPVNASPTKKQPEELHEETSPKRRRIGVEI